MATTWTGRAMKNHALLLLLLAGCSTGPTIYERIDRGPVNPRQFEADKAVCQAIAAANSGPPQMVDSSPAAPMEAMGRLAQTAALAGQQAAAEEEIFVGCMAQRGYVSDISDDRSHNLLVAVEVIKGAIVGSVRSRIPQFDAGPYDPLPGAASQIAKAGRPSPHFGGGARGKP
jgi:hypothetical protein